MNAAERDGGACAAKVSSEYQCGPPVLLSMTSRVQRAQLQLRPTVFNALGLAEVAVLWHELDCLLVVFKDSVFFGFL